MWGLMVIGTFSKFFGYYGQNPNGINFQTINFQEIFYSGDFW